MKKTLEFILIVASLMFLYACDLPHQPGPMPTDIVETEFEAGLNILGVLRADDQLGSSFINVNKALTTEEIYGDTIEDFSPELNFVKVSQVNSGFEYLFLESEDSTEEGVYRDSTLEVLVGGTYRLEISAPGFPTLSAVTTIPEKPQIRANTLSVNANTISFQIEHHASAFEYKAYVIFQETVLEKVITPSNETTVEVEWGYNSSAGTPLFIVLSALDENLTRYGNSPISFIPNTYHPDGSTVENGYGCFGSVAISQYVLN